MSRTKKILIAVYALGAACVCFLLGRGIIGGNQIMNPDAMLPTTYLESSTFLLAAGALPMCIFGFLLYRQYTGKKRILLLIPCVITLCCAVYWLGVIGWGFFNMILTN